jgi:hypothetical protein
MLTVLLLYTVQAGRHSTQAVKYFLFAECWLRRKIRLIERNAKCRYLKELTCKGTLWQVFYLSEVPSPPMTLCSPSYTLY